MFERNAHAAHEALANHRAHRSAHEIELENRDHQRYGFDTALNDDQGVGFPGFLQRGGEAFRIFLGVLELEAVDWQDLRADLVPGFRIEQLIHAFARRDAAMMVALGTNVQVLFEIGAIEHRLASRTLYPQTFGYRLFRDTRSRLDARWQQLLQPAHRSFPRRRPGVACVISFSLASCGREGSLAQPSWAIMPLFSRPYPKRSVL